MSDAPSKPNVARAGGIMIAFMLLSRVLGIVREMAISWRFGQDRFTDAYGASFLIPDLLFYLVAGGALSSAFIPVFTEYLHTKRESEAWHIFSAVTTIMSVIVVGFIAVTWAFAGNLVPLIAPRIEPEFHPLIAHMSRIVLPAQFAFFIGGILFGTLYARQVFAVPGLGPNVYNLGIIVGAVVISQFVEPGVVGMSWGALIGAFVGNLIIPAVAIRRLGADFRPTLDMSHAGTRQVFRLMLPVILGLSLPGVYGMLLVYFGGYYGEGVISAYRLANQLMQAPLGVFGASLALAAFPALAQFYAQDRMDAYRDQLGKTLRSVAYLSLPVSALLIALPQPLIESVFQYGRFTAANTEATAVCLRMFAIGVAAWCMHPVLMRAYFAIQSTWAPIAVGTATTGIFVALCATFLALGYDYPSLPLAGSISAVFLAVVMMATLSKRTGGLDVASVLKGVGQSALCSAVAGGALLGAWTLAVNAGLGNRFGKLLVLAFLAVCAAWLYYFLTAWLKMPETEYIRRAMERLSRKSDPA